MKNAGLPHPPSLRFAAFELDLQSGELRKDGRVIGLPPQPFKVLALLASRQGELVTREEIQREIWGDETVVDFERGLNFAITKIRTALGDKADTPRYIETLPRRGYRFLCQVEQGAEPQSTPAPIPVTVPGGRRRRFVWVAAACALAIIVAIALGIARLVPGAGTARIQTVAVIPFEMLPHNAADDYLADGTTDALIAELGRVRALGVISRTSTMRYKNSGKPLPQIGRELGADTVVEGSVLRSGDHVRITVQLIEASKDRQIWSDSYERSLGDVLTLQGEIARSIAEAVRVRMTPEERGALARIRPVNPEAYELYIHGRLSWNKQTVDGLNSSITDFEKALGKDPGFALAYAGLADAYAALPYTVGTLARDAYGKAKIAANKALAIDPNLVEAVNVLGELAAYSWDWPEAEKQFKRALALNPSYAQTYHDYGFYFVATGRAKELYAVNEKARLLDPLSLLFAVDLAMNPYWFRQYDDAIRRLKQVLEMDPGFASVYINLALAMQASGMYGDAIANARKGLQLDPANPLMLSTLAYVQARAGKTVEARQAIRDLTEVARTHPVSAFHFGFIYLGLGDKERALEYLAKACDERFYFMALINVMPDFDPLRSDSRFKQLVSRIGLPQ